MTLEAAPGPSFAHTGRFFNVLGLALKNAALTIATLTLYRFWARTSMRRRLWSRAWVLGDPLEYTGSAGDLVRGFLIAVPSFFLPAIFVFYIAPFAFEPVWAAWLTLGFYVASVPLVAAARYWMRRYQLSRTRWRGIRLSLEGSAWSFAWASWGWWVLQLFSLGWYTPVARMNRARRMWEKTCFGNKQFEFVEDPDKAAHAGLWWPFALGWVGFAITSVAAWVGAFAAMAFLAAQQTMQSHWAFATPILGLLATGLCWLVFWAPYNAAAMNRIASHLTLDGARFELRAKTLSLFLVTLAGWIIIIVSLGLLAPVAGFLQIRYVLNRLHLAGTPQFAEIGQPIAEGPDSAEGLSDAFDLDMGVGVI